jgi:hypothetical protein
MEEAEESLSLDHTRGGVAAQQQQQQVQDQTQTYVVCYVASGIVVSNASRCISASPPLSQICAYPSPSTLSEHVPCD